jgi:archaea-specific DNA-binding protein
MVPGYDRDSEDVELPEVDVRDNTIFIGNKPFMNYVTSVVIQFTTKEAPEVLVKARGKFISRAVDVVEVARKRFMKDRVAIKAINLDSEEFTNKEGKLVRVSTIEIVLTKM